MEATGLNLGLSMRRLLDGRDGPRTGIALGGQHDEGLLPRF